jgi:hypothetical protein
VNLGRILPVKLTVKQCAALVGVCVPYVAAAVAIADDPDARAAVLAGKQTILDAAKKVDESLADRLRRSTPAELLEAAREIGPTVLWDQMLEPLLA